LVHRDIKPSNILLEDTVERAILTDFGLARAMDDASLTQTGIIAGTPYYMSPEQATGGDIDGRSDLFSLGAVLYFMCTGHPPFRAASALAVLHRICREPHRPVRYWNKDVPDELADIIDQLLEKKPSRRLASAEEVRQRLASVLSRVQQFGVGRRSFSPWRYKRGRRKLLAGLSVLVVAAVATGSVFWFARPGTELPTSAPLSTDPSTGNETEFFTGLGEVRETLDSASRETVYTRARDDSWRREIESLQRDLKRIESKNQ
jgi:serine/threonine protein kinase